MFGVNSVAAKSPESLTSQPSRISSISVVRVRSVTTICCYGIHSKPMFFKILLVIAIGFKYESLTPKTKEVRVILVQLTKVAQITIFIIDEIFSVISLIWVSIMLYLLIYRCYYTMQNQLLIPLQTTGAVEGYKRKNLLYEPLPSYQRLI